MHTITADVPVLISQLRDQLLKAGPQTDAHSVVQASDLVRGLATLLKAASEMRQHPIMSPDYAADDPRSYWHRDVMALAFLLENIVARTKDRIALEKASGRGVRFIVWALQRTRSHPSAEGEAVAKAIKRGRQRPLRSFDAIT